jgi:hypothetical protein
VLGGIRPDLRDFGFVVTSAGLVGVEVVDGWTQLQFVYESRDWRHNISGRLSNRRIVTEAERFAVAVKCGEVAE